MRLQNIITQQRLQELLSYDPEMGLFINLTQRSNRIKTGSVAGHKRQDGYIKIMLDGKLYLAHRLAWLYIYGEFPKKGLDHVDENPSNNRISNLRLATHQENSHNQSSPRTDNTSGFRGVSWSKRHQKWTARIKLNEKYKNLGYFNTAEQASEAHLKAKRENHPFWVEDKVA
jgi:hypothetical protein